MLTVSPQACESTAVKLISALTKVSCLSASAIDDSEILSSVTESLAEVSAFPRNRLFRLLFIPLPNEFRKNSSSLCNSAAIGETLTRSIGNSLSHFYRYQNELLSYKRGKTNERAQQNLVRALRNLYNVTQNLVQIQGYRCYIQPILDTILIQSLRRGLLESQDDLVLILSLTDNLEPTCFSPVLLKFCQSLCRQIESSASVYNPAVPHSLLLAIFTNVIRLPQIRNYYWSLSIAQNKTCYRKLIQFLANPDLCVVIYAMRILALLVWDRPTEGKNNVPDGIGEKLFTSDNISQTVKLAFHLILCHSSSHIVQTAVDLLDVLLKREWIRNWVEGYQHLKTFIQSLTKNLRGMLMSSDTSMCHVIPIIRLFTIFNSRNTGRTVLLKSYAKYDLNPLILGLLAVDRSFLEWKDWVLHSEDKVNDNGTELAGGNERHKASLRNVEPVQFDDAKDIIQWLYSFCSLQNCTRCEMTPPPTPSSIEHGESDFDSNLPSNISHASATSTSNTTIPASDLDLVISTLATLTHSVVSTPLLDSNLDQINFLLSEEWLRRVNLAIDCLLQLLDNEKQAESHRDERNIVRTLANFLRIDVLGDFVCRQLDCFNCPPDEETDIELVEQERVQLIQVCVGVIALISRIVQSGILQSSDTQVAFTQGYLTQGGDMESNVQGSLIKIYSHSRFPHLLASCLCGNKITTPVIISSVLQLLSDKSSIGSLTQEEHPREPWSMDKITKNMGILLANMNQRYLRMKACERTNKERDNEGQPGEWTTEVPNQDHLISELSHMVINDKTNLTKSLNHQHLTFGKNTTKSFVSSTVGLLQSVQDQVVQYSREVEKEMDVRERELMEEVEKWKNAAEKAKEVGERHNKQIRLLENEKESLIKEHDLQLKDVMANTQRQIKDKNDEITQIRSDLAESVKQVEKLTSENGRMKSAVEDLEKRMVEMKLSYETMLANEKKEWAVKEEALKNENEERKRKEIELQGEVARLDEYSETLEAELENHMQFMSRLKESASKVKRRRPGNKEGD